MKIEHYEEVTTGGNCTALSRLFGTNKEILLTEEDGNRSPSCFPIWAGFYYLGHLDGGQIVDSLEALRAFEARISSIA